MNAQAQETVQAPRTAESLRSGKTGADENFPVASLLIAAPLRPTVLAFYDFARSGDDVADSPTLSPAQKHALLDQMDDSLTGKSEAEPLGVKLRAALAERRVTNQHARDLLNAFRLDVDKSRYASWDELIDYCRLSAMPVGRFMLDVHGESESLWPDNDDICAALQINNHLQDCAKDLKALDRVYIPQDALAAAGAHTAELGGEKSSPALLSCLQDLARKNRELLERGAGLGGAVKDLRLGLEIAVTVAHARKIADLLIANDPLCEKVRLTKGEMIGGALAAAGLAALSRWTGRAA
jgi:squalene synthase HpnC